MSRLLRLSIFAGVLAGSSAIIPSASAATVGTITVRPATGTDLTPFTLTTSGACPAGTNVIATIFGPGFTADGENIVPNLSTTIYAHTTTGGVVLPISDTLRDFANDQPDPQPLKGKYRLRVMCRMNAKLGDLGDFVGSITFNGHHGYVVVNPHIPESVLATIAPVPQAAPPLPTSTATPTTGQRRPSHGQSGSRCRQAGGQEHGHQQGASAVAGAGRRAHRHRWSGAGAEQPAYQEEGDMTRGRAHPVAAALVFAVAAWTLMGVVAAPSRAATAGRLSFEPHAGNSATPLSVVSSGRCSDSRATNVLVRVTGPGFPAVGQNVAPNQRAEIYPIDPSSGGYTVPFQDTLQNFAAEQTPPVTLSGRYQFTLVCTQKYGRGTFGTFTGALTFGSGTHFTDGVKAAPATATPGRTTAAQGSTHIASTVTVPDGEGSPDARSTHPQRARYRRRSWALPKRCCSSKAEADDDARRVSWDADVRLCRFLGRCRGGPGGSPCAEP